MNGHARRLLVRQVGEVLVDLPVFLTSPVYRRWHLHWGATSGRLRLRQRHDLCAPSIMSEIGG